MPMHNPPHPGQLVREMIEELELTTTAAAAALKVSRQVLDDLLDAQCGVTPEMALRLEAVFGSTADNWLRVQSAHDLFQARLHEAEITAGLQRLQVTVG